MSPVILLPAYPTLSDAIRYRKARRRRAATCVPPIRSLRCRLSDLVALVQQAAAGAGKTPETHL